MTWTTDGVDIKDESGRRIFAGESVGERGCSFLIPAKEQTRNIHLAASAPRLLAALEGMNHMGGDDRGGYCICPLADGSRPDDEHSTTCDMARAAIREARKGDPK